MNLLDSSPSRPRAPTAAGRPAGHSGARLQHQRAPLARCSAASPDAGTTHLPGPTDAPSVASRRAGVALAPGSGGSVSSWSGGARDSGATGAHSLRIRPVDPEDYWPASDLHCSAFYPRATPFWFAALRVDRVMSLQLGKERPDLGDFLCLVAEGGSASSGDPSSSSSISSGGSGDAPSSSIPDAAPPTPAPLKSFSNPRGEGATRVDLGPLVDALVALLFPPAMRRNYAATYGAGGLRGVVVVDSFGEHVPRKRKRMSNGTVREVRRTAIAYLSNLAVAPCARRSGIGMRLLREAEQAAASWGCRSMALHVDPSNTAAVQLYRSAGYRRVMEQPEWQRWLEGRQTRLVLMMRRLPHSTAGTAPTASSASEASPEPSALR